MPARRLSTSFADWLAAARDEQGALPVIDHLVIGSGYGGAVAARRLAEAGRSVVLLERGSEFLPGEFPNDIALLPKYLRLPALQGPGSSGSAHGLFEWHVGGQVLSLTGNGLGGGSLINAGVVFEPDADVRRQACWPSALRQETDDPDDPATLAGAMQRARRALGTQRWPEPRALKTVALARSAPFLQPGAEAREVELTVDPAACTRCGDCATGCNVPGAKITLRDSYLAQARDAGATLVCGAWAWRLEPRQAEAHAPGISDAPGHLWRWRVTAFATERVGHCGTPEQMARSPEAVALLARHVVVAAGTFGSTELLQRSQALAGDAFRLSPTLGSRFSGNGDALSFAVDMPEPVAAEGHGARAPEADAARPGPTITAVVDLRRHRPEHSPEHSPGKGSPSGLGAASGGAGQALAGRLKPIDQRVIVEDGATPGAIVRGTREMLALLYTLGETERFRARTPRTAGAMDPLSATPMGRHTQVLLAMGHDGAAGHIVRLPGHDRSVPFWPGDLAALPTYQAQQQAFDGLADLGAVHVHAPSWQLLPPSATALMSGPGAPRAMLTVHPLGGCPMGDGFDSGVVDHRGRVWRGPGALWPGLSVLDASIVPSSLGVNPLLTITALAERALEQALREAEPVPALPPLPAVPTLGEAPAGHQPAAPEAFQRRTPATFDVSVFERLVCAAGRLRGQPQWHAEARLELGSADWQRVWDDPRHRVALRGGALRLQSPAGTDGSAPPTTLHYEALEGHFDLLPRGDGAMQTSASPPLRRRRRAPWLRRALRRPLDLAEALGLFVRRMPLFLTWGALRGLDDLRRSLTTGRPVGSLLTYALALARGMAHAAETRRMHYQLRLRRDDTRSTGVPADAPRELVLVGRKLVRYDAGWLALLRWLWRHGEAVAAGRGVPPPRPTYWEQITDPELLLIDAAAPPWRQWLARHWSAAAWATGRFELDATHLLAQTPLVLQRGDLTAGIESQSAYAMHFLRHALKTHLSDFRAPETSGTAVVERQGDSDALQLAGRSGTPAPEEPAIAPVRHRLTVRRGRSEGEAGDPDEWPTQLTLDLWHYACPEGRRGGPLLRPGRWYGQPVWRARSVLLLHAFGQSGAMFTQDAPHPSLARSLLEQGFDVWVLDHRISTRATSTAWPSTIDQIARFDVPAAVARIQQQLRERLLQQDAAAAARGEPIQLFAFGQCIGGAALAMSLLDGRLSHGLPAQVASGGGAAGVVPAMPMLAGAVISQTHPFLVATPLTRAKTWVPQMLQTAFGWRTVPLAVRGPVDSVCEAWLDRLFASLPVPPGEHCPHERNPALPQDDCATCRRIRFFEAPLFKHANLSDEMHRRLPQLFGPANLHLFAHAARCVEHERLVDNDGRGAYVRDDRWRHHMGLPIAFLHGQENELFHVSSARRSAAEHERLFPDQAERLAAALGAARMPVTRGAWELPGFGHVDPVLGEAAPRLVFEPMAQLFDTLWQGGADAASAPALRVACAAALPRSGPWLGHVEASEREGRRHLRVHLAFHLDDRSSAGQAGPGGAPGTRTWAFVRVRSSGPGQPWALHRLALSDYHHREELKPDAPLLPPKAPRTLALAGWRVASGVVEVEQPAAGCGLELEAFSVHEMLLADGVGHRAKPSAGAGPGTGEDAAEQHRGLLADAQGLLQGSDAKALGDWLDTLLDRHGKAVRHAARRRDWLDPAWRQVSRQASERLQALEHRAHLPAAVIAALPVRTDGEIEFAAASCRYPGMAVDALRVDESARSLLACASHPREGAPQPAFAMLLGDQIYADATAGLVDPLNAVERFVERHRGAFAQGRSDALGHRHDGLGALLARVPTYLTPDDHELRDGWPGSGPLQDGLEPGRARENRLLEIALQAVRGFQRQHMPPGRTADDSVGSYAFEQGLLRLFVLDARTERRVLPEPRTVSESTWQALDAWWADADRHRGRLHVLVSGSVLLPRLAPGSNPADPGEDTLAWRSEDRQRLLASLDRAAEAGHCLLLLSGDYHLSAALQLLHRGRKAGAVVVAPSLYAPLPYTNATPQSLWTHEPLPHTGLSMQPLATWEGSGFVSLRAARSDRGLRVTLRHWLRDHAQADEAGRFSEPLTIDLEESCA